MWHSLMLLMDIAISMHQTETPDALLKPHVGFMPCARSSPWPILMRMHGKSCWQKGESPSTIAIEMVRRIHSLFETGRPINGKSPDERRAARQMLSRPFVDDLQIYMREQRYQLAPGNDLAKALDYIIKRWDAFTLFLEDGRVCLSNNAAARALRGIA